MTHQEFDGIIRGWEAEAGHGSDEADPDDLLSGVRDMLDRWHADEDNASESEQMEMIYQILMTATKQAMQRDVGWG